MAFVAAPRARPRRSPWHLLSASHGAPTPPAIHDYTTSPHIPVPTLPAGFTFGGPNATFGGGTSGIGGPLAPTTPGTPGHYDLSLFPGVIAARNAETAGLAGLDAQRTEARRRAIIQFGDPALAGTAGFDLDPQSAAYATQNTASGMSVTAQLAHQADLQRKAIISNLAGRGMLGSGETGYQSGEADRAQGIASYNARNQVLDALRGYDTDYLTGSQNLHQGVTSAEQAAWQFAVDHPELYFGATG